MTLSAQSKPWDFSNALELLNTLSSPSDTNPNPSSPVAIPPRHDTTGLGDLSNVWRYLDTPSSLPQTSAASDLRHVEYTSDGAIGTKPRKRKSIQWRDDTDDGTLTDIAPDTSATDDDNQQRSSQRSRRRTKNKSDVEGTPRRTPARKASVHSLTASAPAKSRKNDHKDTLQRYLREQYGYAPVKGPVDVETRTTGAIAVPDTHVESRTDRTRADGHLESQTAAVQADHTDIRPQIDAVTVPTNDSDVEPQTAAHTPKPPHPVLPRQRRPSTRQVIEPKIIRSGTDRHWAFLLKLIENFYPDRASLVSPANLTTHSTDPSGIHVFVDASNIFIGFHDQLKRARGISASTRVPRVNMSFDSLALLMERRRPVAKRVLAGSTPRVPAFDVAERIGYECAILDKVYKARELTERQKFFATRRRSSESDGTNGTGGTATVTAKMVEQGVDEILHLKILESLVDVDVPGTIVLATGDAAQAEYSLGFMVMVERALKKGWSVELVSWRANISQMYRRPAFASTWGDKFRIIELDEYAEELLDM